MRNEIIATALIIGMPIVTDLLFHNGYKLWYNCVRIEHKGVYNDCNDNSKS